MSKVGDALINQYAKVVQAQFALISSAQENGDGNSAKVRAEGLAAILQGEPQILALAANLPDEK